jgi:hypothetical protein
MIERLLDMNTPAKLVDRSSGGHGSVEVNFKKNLNVFRLKVADAASTILQVAPNRITRR